MQRAGNRRYYRPADVELAERIHRLLYHEGYTVRGVQKLLRQKSDSAPPQEAAPAAPQPAPAAHEEAAGIDVFRLIALRNRLADALESSD
jgi:DNA-binding transcriptional MerR regulator